MTRDKINATIGCLDAMADRDPLSINRDIARDALTLLREIAAVNLPTISCMMEIIDEMDRERKAVKS